MIYVQNIFCYIIYEAKNVEYSQHMVTCFGRESKHNNSASSLSRIWIKYLSLLWSSVLNPLHRHITSNTFSALLSLLIVFDLRKVMTFYYAIFLHTIQIVCNMFQVKNLEGWLGFVYFLNPTFHGVLSWVKEIKKTGSSNSI